MTSTWYALSLSLADEEVWKVSLPSQTKCYHFLGLSKDPLIGFWALKLNNNFDFLEKKKQNIHSKSDEGKLKSLGDKNEKSINGKHYFEGSHRNLTNFYVSAE